MDLKFFKTATIERMLSDVLSHAGDNDSTPQSRLKALAVANIICGELNRRRKTEQTPANSIPTEEAEVDNRIPLVVYER